MGNERENGNGCCLQSCILTPFGQVRMDRVRQTFPARRQLCLVLAAVFIITMDPISSVQDARSMERTLAIIKPDCMKEKGGETIKNIARSSGFHILFEEVVQLDLSRAKSFYGEHSNKGFFNDLIKFITSGPISIMVLEKEQAVEKWRALIGPTDPIRAKQEHPSSIRAMYGSDLQRNCVHGSDSLEAAIRELGFFCENVKTKYCSSTTHEEL